MKQRYHTIIKPEPNGWFVGWVEEVPGTITRGRSLDECRRNLRESLQLMLDTHRDEARLGLDAEDERPAAWINERCFEGVSWMLDVGR